MTREFILIIMQPLGNLVRMMNLGVKMQDVFLPEVNVMVLLTVQIEVMNKAALHLVQ